MYILVVPTSGRPIPLVSSSSWRGKALLYHTVAVRFSRIHLPFQPNARNTSNNPTYFNYLGSLAISEIKLCSP